MYLFRSGLPNSTSSLKCLFLYFITFWEWYGMRILIKGGIISRVSGAQRKDNKRCQENSIWRCRAGMMSLRPRKLGLPEETIPQVFQKMRGPAIHWLQTSGLQNCEILNYPLCGTYFWQLLETNIVSHRPAVGFSSAGSALIVR